MFLAPNSSSLVGGLAAAVPGELRGLEELSRRWGRLKWEQLFRPAIKYAEGGFTVNMDLDAAGNTTAYPFLLRDGAWRRDWAPGGKRVGVGEVMYRKRYARTLRAIAKGGADVFYKGAMARRTVREVRRRGGILTVRDLEGYRVKHRRVNTAHYRGYKLSAGSAPSSGAVVLSALKIFEGWNGTGDRGLETHRLVEGIKFAYGQRTQLGDPDFVDGLEKFQRQMVSEEVAAGVRTQIRDDAVLPNISYYNPEGMASPTPKGGTSHIATLDAEGMAVSLTSTINTFFGSQVMTPSDGIIMNNQMDDFSTPGSSNFFGFLPTPNNYIRPFKRPLSSVSTVIVETPDGQVYFVIGAAGGSRIITATVQNVWRVLEKGLDARAALSSPRLHDQLWPNLTSFEVGYDSAVVADMARRGHNVTFVPARPGIASAQGVMRCADGTLQAVGEPRQWGSGGFVCAA
ncbi:gamma-glutamyltranspeptidase [Tricharina praecox]|uniref:gamma-glutamyltranspeptidase n=1 Tax=Tricharina praecox TaxID=43433 RepID=UPI00221FA664|nr:gamma-glutamyltranspeptidase [Tricharina praecox]KAI5850053.1 gamma-glutamyltranspeptidase [Tricharina praecox]